MISQDRCDFQYNDSLPVLLDEEDESSAVEVDYFGCRLEDNNMECPFTARWCRFKEQVEEFCMMVSMAAGRAFGNEPL